MSIVTLNNRALKDATAVGTTTGLGDLVFISRSTASSSASVSITSGIDSTYKEYIFMFNNIHPASNSVHFQFQGNAAGGSGFNETITSTSFTAGHKESDATTYLAYDAAYDLAQGTGFQTICSETSNDSDSGVSGTLHLFNPSDTTFVKHFIARSNNTHSFPRSDDWYIAGYFNTTSAIDEIQFKFSSGNIDSGTIDMYGVS